MRSAIVLAAIIIALSFNGVPEGGSSYAAFVFFFFFVFLVFDVVDWIKQNFEI